MAKPQTRSETALQSAVMRFGDDAFRICYMHTKSGKETLTLLSEVCRKRPQSSGTSREAHSVRNLHTFLL